MSCQFWPEISICLNEVEKEKDALTKKAINLDMITIARENINRYIEQLRLSLEQSLEKQHSSQILFALVAFVDEDIQRYLIEKGLGNWVPLQKDLYGAYNAGTLYYESIDKIIEDPSIPEIVHRVFYFILKKGFMGKYRDSKTHIKKYLEILKNRISVATPIYQHKEMHTNLANLRQKIKPWHYYLSGVVAALALLSILYTTSSM